MPRYKEHYTKEKALELYKDLRLKFVMDFMNIYNKSPVNTRKMLHEYFSNEEVVGIDSMIKTLHYSNLDNEEKPSKTEEESKFFHAFKDSIK